MKKIITALNNPRLNNSLKEIKSFKIITNDIQYQDGIFEVMNKNNNIEYLILSELIPGKYDIKRLIEKISEKNIYIKIILILEKEKEELENYLYAKGIYKIFYNNMVEIDEIIDLIKNDYTENEKIIKELDNLKKILIKNNININYGENLIENKEIINNKNNIIEFVKNRLKIIYEKIYEKLFGKKINNKKINSKKIISIIGTGGVGKSIATINIANLLKENNYSVLILDFDILNNSLHTILGVNKYPEKIKEKIEKNNLINNKIKIKDLIIKINKNTDLISGINLLFDKKYKISSNKIKNILNELIENYDFIIIDNTSECFFDYTRNILINSDINLFLIESNLSEIKKAERLLSIYNNEWEIEKDKIKLIINKYNKYSIKDEKMKNVFNEYEILGKINFNKKYNELINKSNKNSFLLKKMISREYRKIIKM